MKQRIEYIDLAKGICISLVVLLHVYGDLSGTVIKIMNLFHMPLFFFCSGLFFRELLSKESVGVFLRKKVRTLYFPFVKWSVFFLLLHNLLLMTGVYNSQYGFEGGSFFYSVSDIFTRLGLILFTMTGYEELLGGFWYLRSLFVSCLLIAFVSIILRLDSKYRYGLMCVFFLIMTMLLRRFVPDNELLRELSMGCFGALFYLSGYLFKQYECYWQNKYVAITCCLSLLFLFYYFRNGVSMGCGYNKVIPFYLSGISGTILTLYMSKKIEKWFPMINRFIYDIGNHTLEILALHFLSFRLVSFFVAYGYGLDVVHVAEHPVISDISIVPCYWWIVYSFAGIVIPLILNKVWYITTKRMLWIKL